MRIFRHFEEIPSDAKGAAVAIGNFDGVHLGHQAIIGRARALARAGGRPAAVLTFEPHPRSLFQPTLAPFRLSPFRIKARVIESLGVDELVVLHFDRDFSQASAADFVGRVLVEGLGAAHVVIGYDFVFGHKRAGNAALMGALGAEAGFGVDVIEPVAAESGEIYSSTRIRNYLIAGAPREAAAALGRPWEIEGRVEHGDARGRQLGFPTANLLLGDYLRPALGVYAVRAGIDQAGDTIWRPGVANLGRRPTIGGTSELLEVHLFDFSEDLYGRHLRVQLIEFLRPEKKFDGLAALRAQIAEDCSRARAIVTGPN